MMMTNKTYSKINLLFALKHLDNTPDMEYN